MFYRLKVSSDAKRKPTEILGFPVDTEVSTYIETERDLVAEFEKKGVKTVEISPVDQLPERGEDGNFPRVFDLKDEGLGQQAVDQAEHESEPKDGSATGGGAEGDEGTGDKQIKDEVASDPTTKPVDGHDDGAGHDDEPLKTDYKVLPGELGGGVEYPRGTVHEPGTTLSLTKDEAAAFAPGLIEPVEPVADEPTNNDGKPSDSEQ